MNREMLTSGTVKLTVTLPENFVVSRALLGEEWHKSYSYLIERVENERDYMLFLKTLTFNPRKPDDPGRLVYTGVVNPHTGSLRLTSKSAFPAHATRVRVANKVLMALFSGRASEIENAGWKVEVEVVAELAGRF